MSLAELKKLAGNKKLILGTDRVLKAMKKGEVKKVFLASNCLKSVRETVEAHAKLFGAEVSILDTNNDDLGVAVKKPFAVSVVALLK